MKDFPIPVVVEGLLGPGTQSDVGEDFSYMPIPREVQTFSMPQVPAQSDPAAIVAARDVLARFVETMCDARPAPFELIELPLDVVEVLNQTLGEGEVAIRIAQQNGIRHDVRIQETVFAGVWRERHHDAAGRLLHDYLLAASIPSAAVDFAERSSTPMVPAIDLPAGAMNSPSLLTEIRAGVARYKAGDEAHVINLTLLPLTPDDHGVLERALPVGTVAILSRGFGNCRVTSTTIRNLWRVQYFNSMQTLILDTLEITRVPEVALAAGEDLADSRERLVELIEWMAEDLAA
ncbi:MAG: hydrogenase expression/formation protein [Burkholderiaceae bacterium]|jgi:hydrogenase-1 operon protein HyaF|nr:hydrogenase expression/formation protein [Burkholderiaceae bacterium]